MPESSGGAAKVEKTKMAEGKMEQHAEEEHPSKMEPDLNRGWRPSAGRNRRFGDEEHLLTNRALHIAWHIPWYGFKTQARLAQDSGVSPTAISRLVRGISQPTLPVAIRVTQALSTRLGRHLDLTEVFSLDGSFPTHSVCQLTGCRRCQYSPSDENSSNAETNDVAHLGEEKGGR